jgi:L-serine dehydratase
MSAEPRPASIVNDVLGPVMTGPSSSHTAGPARLGRMVYDLCGGLTQADIYYSRCGSYAATLKGQASDQGFAAGLLGWDCADERLPQAKEFAEQAGVLIRFHAVDEAYDHPNRAVIVAQNQNGETIKVDTLSIGGGNVRITAINGTPVLLDGSRDVFVTLDGETKIADTSTGSGSRKVQAVLPASRDPKRQAPFQTALEMQGRIPEGLSLSRAALAYESSLTGWEEQHILAHMHMLLEVMENAARQGTGIQESPHFRYLKPSAGSLDANRSRFIRAGILEEGIVIATAIMEHDRNMGVIVAAPTAGSAGVLPAVLLPFLRNDSLEPGTLERALLAAGLVGAFFSNQATFAAEEAGCQAENGAASAMAAAALVELSGGDAALTLRAAALALSNLLGLVCDPVAGSVEVPCISRNAMASANAVVAANMVLGGFDPYIPFDEVVGAVNEIGQGMSSAFRCTARGGLAATPTARRIPLDSIGDSG